MTHINKNMDNDLRLTIIDEIIKNNIDKSYIFPSEPLGSQSSFESVRYNEQIHLELTRIGQKESPSYSAPNTNTKAKCTSIVFFDGEPFLTTELLRLKEKIQGSEYYDFIELSNIHKDNPFIPLEPAGMLVIRDGLRTILEEKHLGEFNEDIHKKLKKSVSNYFGSGRNFKSETKSVTYNESKMKLKGDNRRSSIVVRLGPSYPLYFQWYHMGKTIGSKISIDNLHDGDLYILSIKATSNDWKLRSKYTLRHSEL